MNGSIRVPREITTLTFSITENQLQLKMQLAVNLMIFDWPPITGNSIANDHCDWFWGERVN